MKDPKATEINTKFIILRKMSMQMLTHLRSESYGVVKDNVAEYVGPWGHQEEQLVHLEDVEDDASVHKFSVIM